MSEIRNTNSGGKSIDQTLLETNSINNINNNHNNSVVNSIEQNLLKHTNDSLICMLNNNLNMLSEALNQQKLLDTSTQTCLDLNNNLNNANSSHSTLNEMALHLNDYYRLNQFNSKLTVSSPNYNEASSKASSYDFSSPDSIYQKSLIKYSNANNNCQSMFAADLEAEMSYENDNDHHHHHDDDDDDDHEAHTKIQPQQYTKLFVGNLPTSTTFPELLAIFKKYGQINEKLSVLKDQNYAFIHFYNRKDAEQALCEVNDSLFKDRYIRVQFSTSPGFVPKHKNFELKKKTNSILVEPSFQYNINGNLSSINNRMQRKNPFECSMPAAHSSFSLYQKPSNSFGSSPNFAGPIRPISGFTSASARLLLQPPPHLGHNSAFKKPTIQQQLPQNRFPKSSTYSSLLIEASKYNQLAASQMSAFEQYQTNELAKKQQIIQALYLKQQQLQQQQMIQQMQLQQQQAPFRMLPKSSTFDCFTNAANAATSGAALGACGFLNISDDNLPPISSEINTNKN